ncbi:MAG TPA: 4-alpha-glucanotransferase, partial [Clostridiales bacterium]|nr:4-alpha-glucanotransferase [Clostridiales bacterium]
MRASGILLPVSCLPSPYGIGTFGNAAIRFIDFLQNSGQKFWQILPIGPTGYGDSPYQSFSSFAINPYYIDLDDLVSQGLLTQEEIAACYWGESAHRADYGALFRNRLPLLRLAAGRMDPLAEPFAAFAETEAGWLKDYALFMAIKIYYSMAPL